MTSTHKNIIFSMTQFPCRCSLIKNVKSSFVFFSQERLLGNQMRSWARGWKCSQTNSCLSHASWQDKESAVLWLRPPPIKSRECENPSWVGFWVFSCANLDSVQKLLDWHLEYFFLSINVCCNNIWTLEIVLSPDSDFSQNSAKSKLAQNKTKSKEQKELSPIASRTYFVTGSSLTLGLTFSIKD